MAIRRPKAKLLLSSNCGRHQDCYGSDLTDLPGSELVAIRELFRSTIASVDEHYATFRQPVRHQLFESFGLADASIAMVCERDLVVLTTDLNQRHQFQARSSDGLELS